MKKYILISLTLILIAGSVRAQDDLSLELNEGFEGFIPEAGDISVALILGRANFFSGVTVPPSPGVNASWTVSTGATAVYPINEFSNETSNMVGVEIRYYLLDRIALKLSGGAIMEDTPPVVNIPSYNDPDAPNSTWIPQYNSVQGNNNVNLNVNIGAERRKETKFERLQLYYGLTVPLYFSRYSYYDPAIYFFADINYATTSYSSSVDGDFIYTQDIGWRHGTLSGFGAQVVTGADYYLLDGFFIGFEIKPISWIYLRKDLPHTSTRLPKRAGPLCVGAGSRSGSGTPSGASTAGSTSVRSVQRSISRRLLNPGMSTSSTWNPRDWSGKNNISPQGHHPPCSDPPIAGPCDEQYWGPRDWSLELYKRLLGQRSLSYPR